MMIALNTPNIEKRNHKTDFSFTPAGTYTNLF